MLKKILVILAFSLSSLAATAQDAGEYDQQLLQYINQEKWFDAKSLYDSRQDELSEIIRLLSASILDTYFNKPADGVEHTGALLRKYSPQLGDQAFMYRMLMVKNLASLRDYAKVDSVLTYMLTHDAQYLDEVSLKAMKASRKECRALALLPPTEVIYRSGPDNRSAVGMELSDNLFYLNLGFSGKNVRTLLDTGAEYTAIDQSLADELGVHVFRDSVKVAPSTYVKMGILDSLQIGSITIKNEICYLFPDGFVGKDREKVSSELGILKNRALLGISTLRKLSALTVDIDRKTVTFGAVQQPVRQPVNFMLKDNVSYLWLKLNGIPATMFWDTGMNSQPQLSGKFYAEHASSFPDLGPVRKGVHTTVAGVKEYDYYQFDNIPVQIPSAEIVLPEMRVVFDVDKLNPTGIATYDGQMNNIVNARQICIDFDNMCVTME